MILRFSIFWICASQLKYGHSQEVCETPECNTAANILRTNMNKSKGACDHFYLFACGNYIKYNRLPALTDWVQFSLRRWAYIEQEALEFLQTEDSNAGVATQKARDFFTTCMNEDAINDAGSTNFKSEIKLVGMAVFPPFTAINIDPAYDFEKKLTGIHKYGKAKILFDVTVTVDPEDWTTNTLRIGNTPAAVDFTTDHKTKRRNALENYMYKVVTHVYGMTSTSLMSVDKGLIRERAKLVTDFLIKLQQTKRLDEDEINKTMKYVSLAELQRETNQELENSAIQFNWLRYLELLFENINEAKPLLTEGLRIIILNPQQLKETLSILKSTTRDTLASTLWWTTANSVIAMSSKDLRQARAKYEADAFGKANNSRNKECVKETVSRFGGVIAYHLMRKPNTYEHKEKALQMTKYILTSFMERIRKTTWLDQRTKQRALNKFEKMEGIISFEDEWDNPEFWDKTYGQVHVDKDSYYNSVKQTLMENRKQNLLTLAQKNMNQDNLASHPNPAEMAVKYFHSFNHVDLTIAILGIPYYNLGLEALNYGAIGWYVAREIAKALSHAGMQFNELGYRELWWNEDAIREYNKRAACFVETYNRLYDSSGDGSFLAKVQKKLHNLCIRPNPEDDRIYVNGERTVEENIADFVGFELGMDAYQMYVDEFGEEKKLKGFEYYNHLQLYTLAFANIQCENLSQRYRNWVLQHGKKPTNLVRVNGVVMNSERFSTNWKCEPTSTLNPSPKCEIWPFTPST